MFADIQSSNIVGYTAKDVEQGKFTLLSAQFDKVGGGRAINDLLSGVEGVDFGDGRAFLNTAAQIQVFNGVGYDFYYYLNDAWFDNGTVDGDVKAGWADSAGNLVDAEFDEGAGFWLKSPSSAATPSIAGQVNEADTATVSCSSGFQLVANVFPMAITMNGASMTSSDIKGVDFGDGRAFLSTATQMQVFNGVGYDFYYYLNDAWFDNGTVDGDVKAGWADSAGNLVDNIIPAMAGFWTKGTSGAFTLKFTK